ncbi:hypothetical protein B0H11DRAFT_1955147 [Mycena galericulata]|nr:hypothetical protein B0H11DRAFT_1955147 [Mycena galericulata]
MQRSPPPIYAYRPPLYAPNPNVNPNSIANPPPPPPRPQKFLRSALKRTAGESTASVWGGSTVNDNYADTEVGTVGTSTSIASFQTRAPGNKPTQQHRVVNWVHDTGQHAPHFKSAFDPPRTSHASSHHTQSAVRNKPHVTQSGKKEPPPVWIPQTTPTAPQVLRHSVSQPVIQYQQQPPPPQQPQYVQPPMFWVPPPRTHVPVNFVPPPGSVAAKHGRSKTEERKSHGRKRSY